MTCTCYFIGWNVSDTIHLTVNHYKQFCTRIVYCDNYSTDESRDIAWSMGCEVRLFGKDGSLDDSEYIKLKNNVWKNDPSDWVIIVDNDEILYHPDLKFILKQEAVNGTTIFKTQGYNMFSNDVPRGSYLEITTGVRANNYSKLCIFNPKALTDILYVYGCHESHPAGRLTWGSVTLPLLHYMAIGGAERMIERHQLYAQRLSEINKRWGLGIEYTYSPESKRQWFEKLLAKSAPLSEVTGL